MEPVPEALLSFRRGCIPHGKIPTCNIGSKSTEFHMIRKMCSFSNVSDSGHVQRNQVGKDGVPSQYPPEAFERYACLWVRYCVGWKILTLWGILFFPLPREVEFHKLRAQQWDPNQVIIENKNKCSRQLWIHVSHFQTNSGVLSHDEFPWLDEDEGIPS